MSNITKGDQNLMDSDGVFTYNENGFELPIDKKNTSIEWKGIHTITAYKLDLLTTDEICLFIEYSHDKGVQISESIEGWHQFNDRLKTQFPTINKFREFDIATPAFERKEIILYCKKTQAND